MKALYMLLIALYATTPSFAGVYLHYSCPIEREDSSSVAFYGKTLEIYYQQKTLTAPEHGEKKVLTLKVLDAPGRKQVGRALVIDASSDQSETISGAFGQEPVLIARGKKLQNFFIHLELKDGRSFNERSSPDEPEESRYYYPANNFSAWFLSDGVAPGFSPLFSTGNKMKVLDCSRVNYYLQGP